MKTAKVFITVEINKGEVVDLKEIKSLIKNDLNKNNFYVKDEDVTIVTKLIAKRKRINALGAKTLKYETLDDVASKMRVEMHKAICEELNDIYKSKNHDYGNSFSDVRGFLPKAILVRLYDKVNRLKTLLDKEENAQVNESIDDTLKDLSNYAIMELIERQLDNDEDKVGNMLKNENSRLCPKCGAITSKEFNWCVNCGNPFDE